MQLLQNGKDQYFLAPIGEHLLFAARAFFGPGERRVVLGPGGEEGGGVRVEVWVGWRRWAEFLWGRQYSIYNYIGLLLTSEQRANDRTKDLESGGKARPIAGRPDSEVALRGSEDKEVERDFEGNGEKLRD